MNINLFVYYQLSSSNELPVLKAIQKLGNVTRIGNGVWYINASVTAPDALKILASWLTDKDSVVVVDAAANECVWYNLDESQAQRIRQNWSMPLAKDPEQSVEDAIDDNDAAVSETAH